MYLTPLALHLSQLASISTYFSDLPLSELKIGTRTISVSLQWSIFNFQLGLLSFSQIQKKDSYPVNKSNKDSLDRYIGLNSFFSELAMLVIALIAA